jgi:hypothetical protein
MELPRGRASVRPPYAHRPCPSVESDADRHEVAIFIVEGGP